MSERSQVKLFGWIIGIVIFLVVVLSVFPIVVIGAGQRGVVFNNVSGIEPRILGEGTHFRIPFQENVISMSVQEQATSLNEQAGSSDSQNVNVNLTVNWHLNPSKVNDIYQRIGDNDAVIANILTPNAQDAVKAEIAKYAALDVLHNRDKVSANALAILQAKLKPFNIVVDDLSITNVAFSAQFMAAVESAQEQQQKSLQAQYAVTTAEKTAEANTKIQQSLTPALLEQQAIARWNGKLPTYLGAGQPIPFLNLPSSTSTGQ